MTLKSFEITQPDDFHLHLRDGSALARTVTDTARQFARALIMPNLKPPITTIEEALTYRDRILSAIPPNSAFLPFMTLYLTHRTPKNIVQAASETNFIKGIKWYPAGATTHSEAGVQDIQALYPVLAEMEKYQMPLLIHGEVTDPHCDIFEREQRFIDTILTPLIKQFPSLKIVLEHISTLDAVAFIEQSSDFIAATITPHHLLLNRNDLLVGGIHPHYYCLPILKHRDHQTRLIQAATSGNPKFFAGTDSAPHLQTAKESACGCAGIYSAFSAIEIYAEIFEAVHALNKLEAFTSQFGAQFYGLPLNTQKLRLTKKFWKVPDFLLFGEQKLIPLKAGEVLSWQTNLNENITR